MDITEGTMRNTSPPRGLNAAGPAAFNPTADPESALNRKFSQNHVGNILCIY